MQQVEVLKTIFNSPENGFTVLSVKTAEGGLSSAFTATLQLPFRVENGQLIEIDGIWVDSKYGKQYKVSKFSITDPAGANNIESYLATGVIKGIGPALAKRIVEKFGDKTLDTLDANPQALLTVHGIGKENILAVIDSWKDLRDNAKTISAICGLGLSITYATKAFKQFGPKAAEGIKHNPYILTEINGIGFIKADEIAQKLGLVKNHPKRLEGAISYVLGQATSQGHCYLPLKDLVEQTKKLTEITDTSPLKEILGDMITRKAIVNPDIRYYLPHIYEAEQTVWSRLGQMAYQKKNLRNSGLRPPATDEPGYALTVQQEKAVSRAVESTLSVITGAPGTGKTTATNAVVKNIERMGMSYALCAPTGKAAKRLSEATGKEAKTIHRLLEFSPDGSFQKNIKNLLKVDYVLVDEVSMVDILLMASLINALHANTSLILIGDADQLPSVGPGNVLRDIISSGICHVTKLDIIHRQAEGSEIIKITHLICGGAVPAIPPLPDRDVQFIREEDTAKIKKIIVDIIHALPFNKEDIQVLAPMRKGPIGVNEINALLQGLNTEECALKGFKLRDRVIQTKNNYDKEVYNGEVGYINFIDEDDRVAEVDFGDKVLSYGEHELDELSLAYCLSIHRSQGSEFPCVIVPVHTTHFIMLKRELIYTAISRAKKMLVLIGTDKALAIAVNNNEQQKRNTGKS